VSGPTKDAFRSLSTYNYRVWAIGALISNVGTWMQRTAQDWLVLTQLTHNNATAVGVVMALQFGPHGPGAYRAALGRRGSDLSRLPPGAVEPAPGADAPSGGGLVE
jgi:hypothetical protein